MRLDSAHASVELSIAGYQFPEAEPSADGPLGDENWLVVRGAIRTDGRSWTFEDPCLLAGEAQELVRWLRALAAGGARGDRMCVNQLDFVEPDLRFTAEAVTDVVATVTVEFSRGETVTLTLPLADVGAAADDWQRECSAYPERTAAHPAT